MDKAERDAAIQAIGKFVVDEIERATKPLRERIEALERRGYKGIYQRALAYAVGDEVTADGALYVAIAPVAVGVAPGKSQAWQLCAKNIHAQEKRTPTGHRPNATPTEHRPHNNGGHG